MTLECSTVTLQFRVQLKSFLTAIAGDSGSGKTLFAQTLKKHVFTANTIKGYYFYDCYVEYETLVKEIESSKNRVFIIDNADLLLDTPIKWPKLFYSNDTNTYVVFTRDPAAFGVYWKNVAELSKTGNLIEAVYLDEILRASVDEVIGDNDLYLNRG